MTRNTKSPLLSLPGELRNAIYEQIIVNTVFFLAAKDGTIYTSASAEKPKPYNILHAVCRMLQKETNDFHVLMKRPYVIEGQTLIAMCKAKDARLQNLQNTIELHGDMELESKADDAILHDKILALARTNPQATVIVRLPRLHFDTSDRRTFTGFLNLAGAVLVAFWGIHRFHGPDPLIHKWRWRKDLRELNAPNLRFFPGDAECDVDELVRFAFPYAARNVEMMKQWYDDGGIEALFNDVLGGWYEYGL